MPYVKIDLLKGRTEEQKADIARVVTDALVQYGNAKAESVFVVFSDYEKQDWAVGGTLVSQKKA
jgi:4-oxalocrotonate tautomerase